MAEQKPDTAPEKRATPAKTDSTKAVRPKRESAATKSAAATSAGTKTATTTKTANRASATSQRKAAANAQAIELQLVRSPIGRLPAHRRTVAALGLRRIGHTIEKSADPAILGMVSQVRYLLRVNGMTAEEEARIGAKSVTVTESART